MNRICGVEGGYRNKLIGRTKYWFEVVRQYSAETRGTAVHFSDKISDMLFIRHNFLILHAQNNKFVILRDHCHKHLEEDVNICSKNNLTELHYGLVYDLYT
jgi:hypothetical protein